LKYGDKKDSSGNLKDINKSSSIIIENQKKMVNIKINNNIYLRDSTNNITKFKQVLFKDIVNSYLYVKINNSFIVDQLSITDWEFPKLNKIYDLLEKLIIDIKMILNLYIGYFIILYHKNVYNEIINGIKNNEIIVKYKNIYLFYGQYEYIFVEIEIYFYLIVFILFVILSVKRLLFGGFINILKIDFESAKEHGKEILIFISYAANKAFALIYHIGVTIYLLRIIFKSHSLFKLIRDIKKDYNQLNENENNIKLTYNYVGLDLNQHNLNECSFKGYPRSLLYILDENINDDKKSEKDLIDTNNENGKIENENNNLLK
jgi:hypothetical protein